MGDIMIFDEVLESCNTAIDLLANSLIAKSLEEETAAIEEILKDYDELLHHHQATCSALKATKDVVAEKDDSDFQGFNFAETFENCLKEVNEKASKVKYTNLKKFKKRYCAPPNRRDSEVSAVAESSKSSLIDPWTQKTIKELAKSRRCGHYFELSVVLRMISLQKGSNRKKLKCPHVGCTAHLIDEDIEKVTE